MRKSFYTVCALGTAVLMLNLTACKDSQQQEITAATTAAEMSSAEETAAEESQASPDLEEILEAVKDAYGEDYLPNTAIDETVLEQTYGIDPGLYTEFVGEMPMISAHVDTFLAVRAKAGEADTVEELLNAYRDSQIESAAQYPMNMPKYEASQVVRYGNDVYFVMLGAYDDSITDEAELKSFYQEQVQIGLDMISSFYE